VRLLLACSALAFIGGSLAVATTTHSPVQDADDEATTLVRGWALRY
jgi:hypothetical protein